jgi:salicylate hydroxylase
MYHVDTCDLRYTNFIFSLRSMAKLATPPACIPIRDVPALDNWVHESGRMVLVGEAAHPLPVSALVAA